VEEARVKNVELVKLREFLDNRLVRLTRESKQAKPGQQVGAS